MLYTKSVFVNGAAKYMLKTKDIFYVQAHVGVGMPAVGRHSSPLEMTLSTMLPLLVLFRLAFRVQEIMSESGTIFLNLKSQKCTCRKWCGEVSLGRTKLCPVPTTLPQELCYESEGCGF